MTSGKESRRSGRALLQRGELYTNAPSHWRPLCNVFADAGQPLARTLRVQVSRANDIGLTRLPCGVWWSRGSAVPWIGGSTGQSNGAIRVKYGSQGVARTLLFDLASGEYQIPSCEHLYVDCVRYTPGSDEIAIEELGLLLELEVQAEISDGVAHDFTPMVCTAPSSWWLQEDNWQINNICAPPGAYAFELYPETVDPSAANRFELSNPGAIRDLGNGISVPGSPLPVISDVVSIMCRDGYPAPLSVVFFVR